MYYTSLSLYSRNKRRRRSPQDQPAAFPATSKVEIIEIPNGGDHGILQGPNQVSHVYKDCVVVVNLPVSFWHVPAILTISLQLNEKWKALPP